MIIFRNLIPFGQLLFLFFALPAASQELSTTWSACGAYVAPGEWRSFMCYNLGAANSEADPFTPSWEINGGYWQWGRKEMAAAGPSGPGEVESGAGAVAGWSESAAPSQAWLETSGGPNNPCPEGFRVPSRLEWESVLKYNVSKAVGSWENNTTNYKSGWKLGRKLFLPAAGLRYYGDGALNARGSTGYYWTSTVLGSDNAWFLGLTSVDVSLNSSYRAGGRSIRCIAE